MKLACILLFLVPTLAARAIDVFEVGSEQGVDQVVLAETAQDGKLILLPDHCFFSGAEGAKLGGESPATDELNGDKQWTSIDGLKSPTPAHRLRWRTGKRFLPHPHPQ